MVGLFFSPKGLCVRLLNSLNETRRKGNKENYCDKKDETKERGRLKLFSLVVCVVP